MDNTHDLLQDRLARLENGEPLEGCLTGLPPDEAELLRTAALLRAVDYPAPLPAAVAAHRAKVLEAARATKSRSVMPSNAQPRWVLPVAFSAAAALALIVCVVAGLAVAGITWWNGKQIQVAAANPQTAVLAEVRGDVRMEVNDAWERAEAGQTITAGQRIRTGALSSATLIFYDQSHARLGPNTEVWVDALDARTSGPRTIQLTQHAGETDHDVAHSNDPASVYEVRTPSGSGIAKGTVFSVLVTSSSLVRFDVDEGAVAVTNLDVTVLVIAGQSTTIPGGQPPSEPVFRVTGEGEVLQVGDRWNIAGQTFRTDADTVIIGSPEVGDWVAVTGRLLADGARVADQIVLLHRAPKNRFAFTSKVDSIGSGVWAIAGREIHVDGITVIGEGIEPGDTVEVVGGIAQDGAFWASEIHLVSEAPAFEFSGVVTAITDSAWTISGIAITTNAETEISGGIEAGAVVKVEGRILGNGSWLAMSIKLADEDERNFEVSGPVESIDPWKVAGAEFETGPETEMDDGIEVGDPVKVEGRILNDGRWVADEIQRLNDEASRFEFVGKATSTDPWIVRGVTLSTGDNTEIVGEITVGDFIRVKGKMLPDGTWLAEKIERIGNSQGCVDISTMVSNVDAGQVVLLSGQIIELDDDVQVNGEIKPAAVVLIRICVTEDGEVAIVSITVIFQLEPLATATPTLAAAATATLTPTPTAGGGEGDKVTICHKESGKNPHTITVSRSALDAHLGHGDTLGPCQQDNDDD